MAQGKGYEELLAHDQQITQELGTLVGLHERLRSDHVALKELYESMKTEHTRVKDQLSQARQDAARNESAKRQLESDFNSQRRQMKQKLDVKIAEFEDLQQQVTPPRDLDMLRLKITEEVEAPFRAQVRQLEAKMADDQKRATEAKRHAEVLKIELQQVRKEGADRALEAETARKHEEEQWRRKVASLEEQLRVQTEVAAEIVVLRGQLLEQTGRARIAQQALAQAKQSCEADIAKHVEDLNSRLKEAGELRQQVRGLEADGQQKKRQLDALQAENGRLDRELRVVREKLGDFEKRAAGDAAFAASTHAAQVADLERSLSQERALIRQLKDQHAAEVRRIEERAAEAEHAKAMLAEEHEEELRRRETDALDKEETLLQKARSETTAKERAEAALQTAQVKASADQAAAEIREQELRGKVGMLEDSRAQLEATRDAQDREKAELQDRVAELDILRKDYAELQMKHRDLLVDAEKHSERANAAEVEKKRLQVEFADLSATADKDRVENMSALAQANEKHSSEITGLKQELLHSTEQARKAEEQAASLQKASKRLVEKAKKKLSAYRSRVHTMAASARQLEEEKRTALQICEENRTDYERRLTEYDRSRRELDLLLGSGAGLPGAGAAAGGRAEVRGIKDRLAAQAAKYKIDSEAGLEPPP